MSTSAPSNTCRRVLLPLDRSEHSRRAVQWYLSNMHIKDDFVYFYHVAEPTIRRGSTNPNDVKIICTSQSGEYDELSKLLSPAEIEEIKRSGLQYSYKAEIGIKPGEMIVTESKNNKVAIIVIGSRGVSKWRRAMMGSVSDYVMHNANLAVAVVPPPQSDS